MFNPHSALIKALLYLELWRWEHLEPRAARTAKSILCNSHLNHATKQLYFTCAYNYYMLWTARHWWLAKTTSAWIRSWSLCVRPCNCVSTEATRTPPFEHVGTGGAIWLRGWTEMPQPDASDHEVGIHKHFQPLAVLAESASITL